VLSRRDVPRVDRVDFALNVGSRVPSHVRVVEVPETLIEIHPEWRGHRYFVANDEILIVDNDYRIISTVPVGASSGALDTGRGAQLSNNEGGINLSSDEIRQVQIVLREKGFLNTEPDGVFGPRTRQALIMFQERQGLQGSGRIDQQTFAALGMSEKGGAGGQSGTTGRGGEQPQGGNMQQPSANQPSGNQSSTDRGMRNGQGGQQSTTGQGGNNQPSTAGKGGKMQPPANQDVGRNNPSSQKMDQGNSNMNENTGRQPK
jgi:peptidoglycan hydrolase-like protein with peptidoglycan-binding domain